MSASHPTSKDATARMLKKRESDRRCQRIKRERTKTKIAALEERVRSFGDQDPTGQVQSLMQQLQEVERQRDDLAKKVHTIENVIRDGDAEETFNRKTSTEQDNSISRQVSPHTADSPDHDRIEPETLPFSHKHKGEVPETSRSGEASMVPSIDGRYLQHNDSLATPVQPLEGATNLPPHLEAGNCSHASAPSGDLCECCASQNSGATGPQFNTWRFTNQVLSSRFKWPAYFQLLQDTYKDDTPVRIVVDGWEAIGARGPLHPSWYILKKIDQVLFGKMGVTERLAVIYSTQLLLMSHTSLDVLPDLPQFYLKRPSQNLADSYAIHFFPWPGMRERFVFNQHRYCTNKFWNTFINGLRLVWPFEFRDCYTRNLETGRYAISPQFRDRVNDIKCWAMDADIFNQWPELRVDIPVYNSIPPAVSNMIQRPKLSKKSSRTSINVACKTQAMITNQPSQRAMSTQIYIPSDDAISMPVYYQPPFHGVDDKSMPTVNWAGNASHQLSGAMDYFVSTSHTTNLGDSF